MLHECQGMYMEATKHVIAAPAPHNTNLVKVGTSKKGGHGPTFSEQTSSGLLLFTLQWPGTVRASACRILMIITEETA